MNRLTGFWRRCFYGFLTRIYFARITLLNPERRPQTGPVLYLGLHRNGAVDGFVYDQALGGPTFMISTQLRRNWFARLFFTGIAVTRTKDEGDGGANDAALRECVELLHRGGALFVFPEGTSSLGPRHLPFKSGAIWLTLEYLTNPGPPLQVIPVGIHYECPWAFRAKVEVVLGEAIDLASVPGLVRERNQGSSRPDRSGASAKVGSDGSAVTQYDQRSSPSLHNRRGRRASSPQPSPPEEEREKTSTSLSSMIEAAEAVGAGSCDKPDQEMTVSRKNHSDLVVLKALKRTVQVALENVGINVPSEEYQSQIQRLAYTSTLATPRSYFASLKALERQIPEPVRVEAQRLDSLLSGHRLLTHQGVPLVPMGPAVLYVIALLLLSPVVVAAVLFNAPPMLAGLYAGKKFPDDVNVISLWKILVGIPVFLIWIIVVSATLLLAGKPLSLLVYGGISWAGLHLYYRVKKLGVAVHNGLRHPRLRPEMLRIRELVLQHLPPDPSVGRGRL